MNFSGPVDPEEVSDFYNEVDVMIIPRKSSEVTEIVPSMKPLEGMSYSKLVVCSDISPHKEIIRNGKNGLLFEENSPESLAEVIKSILIGNVDLRGLSANGYDWAKENRSWKEVTRELRRVYLEYEILVMADSKIPDTNEIIRKMKSIYDLKKYSQDEVRNIFERIVRMCKDNRQQRNIFLSFLRFLGRENSSIGVNFGINYIDLYADKRSLKTLSTFLSREGRKQEIWPLLINFPETYYKDWHNQIQVGAHL